MGLGHKGLHDVFLNFEFEADHYRGTRLNTRKTDKDGAGDRNPTVLPDSPERYKQGK
jgi:hypothetical protein